MVLIHLKFQQIFSLLRVLGTFTNTWPPHPNIGKYELFLRNFYYCVAIFIYVTTWISMLVNVYKTRHNDVGELMKNISHLTSIMEAILNSILCTVKRKQLQVTIFIIGNFFYTC